MQVIIINQITGRVVFTKLKYDIQLIPTVFPPTVRYRYGTVPYGTLVPRENGWYGTSTTVTVPQKVFFTFYEYITEIRGSH